MNNKSNTPLVSVVIAAYNSANFIRNCLTSILSQTYSNIEIIVVDDGSTDETISIIQNEFCDKVQLIRQSNKLVAKARHNGMLNISGDYVAFCDHDDMWLPDKIEKQIMVFKQNPACSLVYTDAEELRVTTGEKSLYSSLHPCVKEQENIFANMIRAYAIPLLSTVMIHVSFMKNFNISFDCLPPGVDDIGIFLQVLMHGGGFIYLDEVLVLRLMHGSNQSSDYLLRFQRRILLYKYLLNRYEIMSKQNRMFNFFIKDVKWGLSDASYRTADGVFSHTTINEVKHLYYAAWKYNKSNFKALFKLFILILGGHNLMLSIKNRI